MSAREEIETNRLLRELHGIEIDKLVNATPEELMQIKLLSSLVRIEQYLSLLLEVKIE